MKFAAFGLVLFWLMLAGGPFLWTVWGSFKVQGDFFSKSDWTNAIYGIRTTIETGGPFTGQGYSGAWIEQEFWRATLNTFIVVLCTVTISLTFGTLGGYALARSGRR
jgi:multiple sugar transport system permease protein